jgi:hypothetical protein
MLATRGGRGCSPVQGLAETTLSGWRKFDPGLGSVRFAPKCRPFRQMFVEH